MTTPTAAELVSVRTHGPVPQAEVDYARTRVDALLRYARDPVLHVRVKLVRFTDPALARPALAQTNIDLNGRLVRAQVARPTMREAVDEVHDRLRDRLQRAAGDWEAIRGGRPSPEPHEWRHASEATDRAPAFPRPAEERQVIRHKSFGLSRMTLDEAAFDMAMLDYAFHLFTEEGSGRDSVLYRTEEAPGLRLSQVDPRLDLVEPGATPVSFSAAHPPKLTAGEAVERLNLTGRPFVFFADRDSGRGSLLYVRYDGHYGLITPAGSGGGGQRGD